jgi:carbon monoxide dehydrogenase subunit G
MPDAANEIVIARPREEVFEFFANPENDTQWRSGVIDIKRVSGNEVGARYAQRVKGPGSRRIDADIEITEWSRPTTIAFKAIAGPVRPHGRYTFTPVDDGTRVQFELEAQLSGLKRLMGSMVKKTMEREVAQLSEAKKLLESR